MGRERGENLEVAQARIKEALKNPSPRRGMALAVLAMATVAIGERSAGAEEPEPDDGTYATVLTTKEMKGKNEEISTVKEEGLNNIPGSAYEEAYNLGGLLQYYMVKERSVEGKNRKKTAKELKDLLTRIDRFCQEHKVKPDTIYDLDFVKKYSIDPSTVSTSPEKEESSSTGISNKEASRLADDIFGPPEKKPAPPTAAQMGKKAARDALRDVGVAQHRKTGNRGS